MAKQSQIPCDPAVEKTQVSYIQIDRGNVSGESSDKIIDGVCNWWDFSFEFINFQDGKSEKISEDIIDMLPSDPFGMDISATFNTITSWIEEFEKDYELSALGFVMDETDVKNGGERIYAGMNVVLNGAMKFNPEVSDVGNDDCDGILRNSLPECIGGTEDSCNGGDPHDALFFALGHLGVQDLLSVERVCKSFRNFVQNDPLLWRNIHVAWPLSDNITDDILCSLASRARGSLECLSLVKCRKITDAGLKHVLETNPRIEKLGVPGCSGLSIEGIVDNIRTTGSTKIKNLRIGGIYSSTNKHFEELMALLDMHNHKSSSAYRPWFYRGAQPHLSIYNDRAIDIEACPKCKLFRQVYDCPADSCQGKDRAMCRACIYCIARCYICGCCIKYSDVMENFTLDLVCMPCWKHFDGDNHGRMETHLDHILYCINRWI